MPDDINHRLTQPRHSFLADSFCISE